MFFDLLNIKTPEWYQTFIDGRRLTSSSTFPWHFTMCTEMAPSTVYRKSRGITNVDRQMDQDIPLERTTQTLKLTDHYIALLVLIFTKAGLVDVRFGFHFTVFRN